MTLNFNATTLCFTIVGLVVFFIANYMARTQKEHILREIVLKSDLTEYSMFIQLRTTGLIMIALSLWVAGY